MTSCLRNLLLAVFLFMMVPAFAQPSLEKMQQKLLGEKANTPQSYYRVELLNKNKTQASIFFSSDRMPEKAGLQTWFKEKLELRPGMDALLEGSQPTDYFGASINKVQQYFKGIKVEHGVVTTVAKAGKVQLLQLEFYTIKDDLAVAPLITEEAAFQIATRHIAADKYSWDLNKHGDPNFEKHKAELVIVEDMIDEPGKMCLAYKCDIYAISPLSRDYIYVNAANGHIVFKDAIIRHVASNRFQKNKTTDANLTVTENNQHTKQPLLKQLVQQPGLNRVLANATGWGDTRYSGRRYITTNLFQANSYELKETGRGNNTEIETININKDSSTATYTAFVDDNNRWTTAEFDDPWYNNMALDIHWATEQIVDYWWKVHGRKSFDNANAKMWNLVHFKTDFDNAFWDQGVMWYGDGSFTPGKFKPLASIDVCGHEIGHAVCEKTAALVYARESGALNEGFSDIWGACIDNYVKDTVVKKPYLIGDEIMATTLALRSMADPHAFNNPDTYLDTAFFWKKATIEACPVPDGSATGNDDCGVHYNSGVLSKWFYLISNGGSGTNGNHENYNVTGMGFPKSERIAFFTEQILTPNSGYGAARSASMNAVWILASSPNTLGITFADTATLAKAWRGVGVGDSVFNEINTPIFDTSLFTTVAVGKYGYIWAGTANRGLYKYNGAVWQKAPVLLNHNIADIKADKDGGIWIAQFGRTGAQALNGGIDYFPDSSFTFKQFSTSEGVPTRNVRSLFLDNYLVPDTLTMVTDTFKRVWAACFSDITGSVTRNGNAVRGLPSPVTDTLKYFKKILNVDAQAITYCQTIAGSKDEVWVFVSMSTPDTNKIIRYRRSDTAYLGAYDLTNSPFPQNFNVKAMYYDSVWKKWWVGMGSGGVYIYNEQSPGWTQINFPTIFPAGTIVNNNAIIGDVRGNIYIGTNKGYIFCGDENATGPVNAYDSTQYKRFTNLDGLPANNVKALAIDYRAARLVVATDSGIIFKYTLCRNCINSGPSYTTAAGLWNNPGIWNTNSVPGLNTNVVVQHAITIPQDASCNSIKIQAPGTITVSPGVNLKVNGVNYTATGQH
jgi:Zn-dependent metalloprotease